MDSDLSRTKHYQSNISSYTLGCSAMDSNIAKQDKILLKQQNERHD